MTARRASACALALLFWPALHVGLAPSACAAGDSAALVIDTGDAVTNYCVELPDESVSGLELIVLAGEQHGLSYRFGFGGQAVCMLEGVGPTGDDCFEYYPDFWGYWRGDGSGGWTWSSSGAGSARVSPGDVEGWSWGSGDDGSSHPPPPSTRYSDVCTAAAPARTETQPHRSRGDRDARSAQTRQRPARSVAAPARTAAQRDATSNRDADSKTQRRAEPTEEVITHRSAATPGPEPHASAAARPAVAERGGARPPLAGIVALALASIFVVGGLVLRHRRP
ncbi:MAG: hypothetical protein M3161_06330 [Actinomycetota bacterium]|nr:hypothetical protein [Actinomycetota bacterium]